MTSVSSLMQTKQPLATGAWAEYPYNEAVAKKFRLKDRFGEPYMLYKSKNGKMYLPRALCPLGVKDTRVKGYDVDFDFLGEPRDEEQNRVIVETYEFLKAGQSGIVECPTGFGKSVRSDTPVLMADGSIKKAYEIEVGDQVMGPDSTPRNVLGVNPGKGSMYRIVPNKGEAWECNDVHILTLRCTADCDYGYKGQIVDVRIDEYLAWPKSKKHVWKQWRTGVAYPHQPTPEDPYLVGLYLAEGTAQSCQYTICDTDDMLVDAVGLGLGKWLGAVSPKPGAVQVNVSDTSPFWLHMQTMVSKDSRGIADCYKVNSESVRLNTLAGLLDGDGHLVKRTVYEFVTKYARLADDVCYLARSLGLAAYKKKATKTIKSIGFSGYYWRVHISGDTDRIPCRVPRKKAIPRKQKKDVTNVGFKVEAIGEGDYFGIVLDGDRRFLLGDFTVTHNTFCALMVTALMRVPTLVVCTKEDLFEHWIEEAHRWLGLPYNKIGILRADKCTVGAKPFSVGMIQSLSKDGKYPDWVKRNFALVHFDEVHRLPADEFSKVAGFFASMWRLGWSATPYRADGKEIVFKGHIGPVRVVSEMLPMIPEVYRYWSKYELPWVNRPKKDKPKNIVKLPHTHGRTMHVVTHMAKDVERNRLIAKLASMCYKSDRKTVLFSDTIDHLNTLHGLIIGHGVKPSDLGFYIGGMSKDEKVEAKKKKFLLATYGFMKEGSDIPALDACIMATPKSEITQIIGRVLRSLDGKKTPIVIDIIDDDSYVFSDYAGKRLKKYHELGAKVADFGD